jgi:ketol-acid reductoisomerase
VSQNVRDQKFVRNIKEGCTIAVHPENDPKEEGFEQAKAYAVATEDIKEF